MDEARETPRPAAAAVQPSASPRYSRRKIVRIAIIALVVGAAIVTALVYWLYWRHYVGTDNAYVNANTAEVAAQVSGQVTAVYVRDQQTVNVGDPLFDIDPRTYEAALAKAEAELAQRQAEEANARHNEWRAQQLVASGFYSKQGAESARTAALTASASVRAAQANLQQARLDLDRTHVRAPTAGYVANLSLRPGNTVTPGAPLFSIVGNDEFWVDANFKETELSRVHPGQPARVTLDMYPKHPFDGVVESVSPGSGAAFSLLPPQNATGNWVKVTQRVPVRVRITNPDPAFPLRIGTTATVDVKVD
jgi:membrane fusion protein (multidrug efflux system)